MPTKRRPRSTRQKVSGSLKQMVESRKAPTVLLGDIQQHAVKKALEDDSRRQNVIHPSEMAKADWCPRQTTYRIRGVEPSNPRKLEGYHLLTIFQEGHDIHSKWQTWLGEMGRLWGKWKCPVCEHTMWSTGAPHCTECFTEHGVRVLMGYAEVTLDAEGAWLIAGHADGAVPDIESFIEVKSIGLGTIRMEEPELVRKHTVKVEGGGPKVVDYDSIWKGLKRPLLSHRKQAAIYLAIAKHLGWPYKRMLFIYENKANQQVKEFSVGLDEDLADELIDTAKDIKWAVENDTDLPRPVDYERDKKPCKECPWLDWCWAGEETDEQQDRDEEPDATDGARVPRSKAKTRTPADPDADQTEERLPRSARRSNRPGRQRTDAADDRVHEVGGVPERPTGGSRSGRKVRRTRTRQG